MLNLQERQPSAAIAIDLGGTKLASCLFAEGGRPREKQVVPLGQRQGREVGQLVVDQVHRLQRAAVALGATVSAIGVSVPGIADLESGRVWAPNIRGWDDYPLRESIQASQTEAIPVVITGDRAAYILGEAWHGAARGCRNAIFLAVGTGIGAGILADGRVLYGSRGIAGAIGWLALSRPFMPEYVSCGCFESHASGQGLARQFTDRRSRQPGAHKPTARDVFAAYEQGDATAAEMLAEAILYWGMASANLVSLLDPEKIIFGGGVFGPATRFLNEIAEEARRWAQPISMRHVTFEASQLGADVGLHGAGHLACVGPQPVDGLSPDTPPVNRS